MASQEIRTDIDRTTITAVTPPTSSPPVILIIESLPTPPEADIPGSGPKLPVIPDYYAAVYGPVLSKIFKSPLYKAGRIGAVFVQFPTEGWFKIEPKNADFWVNITEKRLDDELPGLFENKSIWSKLSKVPTIAEEVAEFPANTHIIGCVAGAELIYTIGARPLKDYLSTTIDDHTYAFVTWVSSPGELRLFIEENLAVEGGAWEPAVYAVCDELGKKWNVAAN